MKRLLTLVFRATFGLGNSLINDQCSAVDQELGERCLSACDSSFLKCTSECGDAECLSACNRANSICVNCKLNEYNLIYNYNLSMSML